MRDAVSNGARRGAPTLQKEKTGKLPVFLKADS
jgi:hypothetical protein